jgi:hypothetical protein
MRYFTWKLDWSSGVGTDPTSTLNSDTIRIEPQFATGDLQDPNTLVYSYLVKGDIDTALLSQWSVQETTVDAMFAAALVLNADATLVDGIINFPVIEITGV